MKNHEYQLSSRKKGGNICKQKAYFLCSSLNQLTVTNVSFEYIGTIIHFVQGTIHFLRNEKIFSKTGICYRFCRNFLLTMKINITNDNFVLYTITGDLIDSN